MPRDRKNLGFFSVCAGDCHLESRVRAGGGSLLKVGDFARLPSWFLFTTYHTFPLHLSKARP
jgi:hypothetical protein